MIDLYIDLSSGANVTDLINSIVSSGFVPVDDLIETLNVKFGNIAEFSYQSRMQDGESKTHVIISSNIKQQAHDESQQFASKRTFDSGFQIVYDIHPDSGRSSDGYPGEARRDSVGSINQANHVLDIDMERLSKRWPAKIQLFGAALYSILKAYDRGRIFVLDSVRLSNGMSYNLEEAWKHRNFLIPDECAALGAVLLHGQPIGFEEFNSLTSDLHNYAKDVSDKRKLSVYFADKKDKLYKS